MPREGDGVSGGRRVMRLECPRHRLCGRQRCITTGSGRPGGLRQASPAACLPPGHAGHLDLLASHERYRPALGCLSGMAGGLGDVLQVAVPAHRLFLVL